MALDFLLDLVLEPLLRFAKLLLDLLVELVKAARRAVRVKRTAPEERHTFTEYADAFLFPEEEEDDNRSNQSSSLSILEARRH
jgi:hypothetical protein